MEVLARAGVRGRVSILVGYLQGLDSEGLQQASGSIIALPCGHYGALRPTCRALPITRDYESSLEVTSCGAYLIITVFCFHFYRFECMIVF